MSAKPICLCPPASEYDPPCPEHGVVGLGCLPPRDAVLTPTDATAVADLRAALAKAPTAYNRRYLAYAAAHGRDPEAMLAHDDEAWPGGKMTGFMLWISERWQAWAKARGIVNLSGYVKSDEDHADFDRFIAAAPAKEQAK